MVPASCEICRNCKYYVEHYIILNARFHAIGGHCINDNVYNPRKKTTFKLRGTCEFWECNESVKTERRKKIDDVLREVEKHLFFIKEILDNDL